ncbi:MAG: hypothetical protein COX19_13055 [Desulfobacterales bacterium CG23_combo_of_CG06-09_8_20_14_all_51_8]|nr:MAG: hypothetical protein COX19_13055 [Desulfobacterales bacterium CG23_combo_of_CG06-09_8_20_14_all_51_8]
MEKNSLYASAHLVVAAIRIHEHRHGGPPTIEHICDTLSISPEEGNRLCHKLSSLEIIEALEKSGETRVFIKNHLNIEKIPSQAETRTLRAELDEFKKSREAQIQKIKSIQSEQAEKKKKLHEELEQRLKAIIKN